MVCLHFTYLHFVYYPEADPGSGDEVTERLKDLFWLDVSLPVLRE
jgi:hypothetical protein